MARSRELAIQEPPQGRRGLDRNDLPRTVDEVERQPTRARPDFDDALDVARQPAEHAGMEPLRADKPVIELRLEPVQELPRQGDVGLRIADPVGNEPPHLVLGEHAKVRGGVAPPQLPAPPRRRLRRGHKPRPSSCRSPTGGPTAAVPPGAPS